MSTWVCGCGCLTMMDVVRGNSHLTVYACDFSAQAVQATQEALAVANVPSWRYLTSSPTSLHIIYQDLNLHLPRHTSSTYSWVSKVQTLH